MLLVHDMPCHDRHGHRAGMPAARSEALEVGLGGGFVGQMEGLRVVFAREFEHFLARHGIASELGLMPDLDILEIDQRQSPSPGP